jgi:hypothetical protein
LLSSIFSAFVKKQPFGDDLNRFLVYPRQGSQVDRSNSRSVAIRQRATLTGEYRHSKTVQEFSLPTPTEQAGVRDILAGLKELLLPPISDVDIQLLNEVLGSIDQVLFQGLQDPDNWLLPRSFTQIPFVKNSLDNGVCPEIVIKVCLECLRTFVWLYLDDLEGFIPAILELEEAYSHIVGSAKPRDDTSSTVVKTGS